MYIPELFRESNSSVLDEFVAINSFATLISTVEDGPCVTHLPLILDRTEGTDGVLLGHVARANPHWQVFDGQHEALAIFHGPHAYVSPQWYNTAPAVPTWNLCRGTRVRRSSGCR